MHLSTSPPVGPPASTVPARRGIVVKALGVLVAAIATVLAVVVAPQASAATLTEVTGFGTNPSNLRMHIYVPDRLAARPPVLLAVHYCTGTGPAFAAVAREADAKAVEAALQAHGAGTILHAKLTNARAEVIS